MCGLCGAFGGAAHWSDGLPSAGRTPTADRLHRSKIASDVLAFYGLSLREWSGRYTLTSRTGRTAIVAHQGALWAKAERLSGRACDPLDPAVIDAMERGG